MNIFLSHSPINQIKIVEGGMGEENFLFSFFGGDHSEIISSIAQADLEFTKQSRLP